MPTWYSLDIIFMHIFFQLKVYAAKQEVLAFVPTPDFIGYTLPSTSVTTGEIPSGSDVIMVNLYSSILWLLYATSTVLLLIWYYHKPYNEHKKHKKERIQAWIRRNKSLQLGW